MAKISFLKVGVLSLSLLQSCNAANDCPGQPPDATGACSLNTFVSALSKTNAFVASVNKVPSGSCFGQDSTVDIAPPPEPVIVGNYARNLAVSSCAVVVGNGNYRFGLMLPDPAVWKGSLLAVGNAGFEGGINWVDLSDGVNQGLASLSTDTGHNSSGFFSWTTSSPTAIEDWGFEAMNGSVVLGKILTKAYYSKDISYSYYSGCSTGGRQGLISIQRNPELFDGVLVGAPAWDQVHLMPWVFKAGLDNLNKTSGGQIIDLSPKNLTQWITNHVLMRDACDALDGVPDGVISRPDKCNFATIADDFIKCGGRNASATYCYTQAQVDTLKGLYSDTILDGTTFLFPAPEVGSQPDLFGTYFNATPGFGALWAQQFLGFTPDYTYEGVKALLEKAVATDPGHTTANGFDLSAFKNRKGKLILYQGLADGLIPPKSTTNYWLTMQSRTGGDVNDFARYYQVPGMKHCWLSDTDATLTVSLAPWLMGGAGHASIAAALYPKLAASVFGKPETDAFAALRAWVEQQKAPANINATAPIIGDSSWRTRPLCPFPQNATLKKTGSPDINKPESWDCTMDP